MRTLWRWLDRPVDARWWWVVAALAGLALALMVLKGWA